MARGTLRRKTLKGWREQKVVSSVHVRHSALKKKKVLLCLMRAGVQIDISRAGFYWTAPVLRDEACCGDSSENHITVIPIIEHREHLPRYYSCNQAPS